MTYVASGVTVRIGPATLLDGVSIEVRPGEIVAVAGPNGAGKSTLISVLAGDRAPASGSVSLDGRVLTGWPRAAVARRRAVMSTDGAVAFAFSAEDVVLMGRMPLHGGDPSEVDRKVVARLLEAVDCAHLAGRVFATLSTGERQRVQLARAVAQVTGETDDGDREGFLLLDEPTSSLDPAHQHVAMRLLRRVVDSGAGVLTVLHDLNLAAAYADRIVLMHDGRVAADGPPGETLQPDLLAAVFDIPMLVIEHPRLAHPLVVAEARAEPV